MKRVKFLCLLLRSSEGKANGRYPLQGYLINGSRLLQFAFIRDFIRDETAQNNNFRGEYGMQWVCAMCPLSPLPQQTWCRPFGHCSRLQESCARGPLHLRERKARMRYKSLFRWKRLTWNCTQFPPKVAISGFTENGCRRIGARKALWLEETLDFFTPKFKTYSSSYCVMPYFWWGCRGKFILITVCGSAYDTAERRFSAVRSLWFRVSGYCTKWRIQGQFC